MADSAQQQSWGIVGGGLLGMGLAQQLAAAGQRVTLFEAAAQLGGLASAWDFAGIRWDRHYHVTLLSDLHLRNLLRELDLESDMQWVQTRTGFYMDGRLHSMSNSVEFLRFPPLSMVDKFRLGATIFYASKLKNAKPLEKITAVDWLLRLSGRNVFQKIWLPLLRAKLGENYPLASAAFIWAIIARMYAARRSGLKQEMFGYLPGGYHRLLSAFSARLSSAGRIAAVRNESCGRARMPRRRCFAGVGGFGSAGAFRPDDSHHAIEHCREAVPQLGAIDRSALDQIRYQGIVCASVLLTKPLAGYYVTNLIDDWVPFTAVIEMTALVNPAEFSGRHLVYLPKYLDPSDALFDASDNEIRSRFIAALLKMYPVLQEQDVLDFKVSRERCVLAIPTLNYSEHLPPMTTKVPGLHVVNSAHIVNGTLNVDETLQLAKAAAALLLKADQTPKTLPAAAA